MAVLTVLRDGQPVATQPIEGEVVLGRAEGCVIRLDDRAISRQHAVFRPVNGGVQVERKSEFAPLAVNGAECTRAVVKEGDVISIGPYLLRLSEEKAQQQVAELQAPEPQESTVSEVPEGPMDPILGQSEVLNLADVSSEPPPLEVPAPAAEPAPFDLGLPSQADELATPIALEPPSADPIPEITSTPEVIEEDAKTRIASPDLVQGKLILPPEAANVTELEIGDREVTIGRGSECDVVLNSKKASRKHAVIRRSGAKFVIQDLDSANGTFVNGRKIRESELTGDDEIRIGNQPFRFRALNQDYLNSESEFMPLEAIEVAPPHEEGIDPALAALQNPMALSGATQAVEFAPPAHAPAATPIGSIAGIGTAQKPKSLIEKFRALPPKRQVIWAVIVAGIFYFAFIDEDTPHTPPPHQAHATAQHAKGKVPASFERLTDEQKRFVIAQHDLAFEDYKNKDYDKAIYEIEKIFTLIPDYKDSREIERYAKEGKRKLEALEEERRKKEEEAKLKAKVQQLVDQADEDMKGKKYDKARDLFYQILAIEPDNVRVSEWKKEIEAWEEEQKRIQTQREVEAEINKSAWAQYRQALAIQKKGSFHSAIAAFTKVKDLGATDKRVLARSRAHIAACRKAIRDALEPVLTEAKQLEQSGEFRKAYDDYKRATQIEPHESEGWKGMQRVHRILRTRARLLYAEGVMAESYSDLDTAKKKFTQTMAVAPPDDVYYERAQAKLSNYIRRDPAASSMEGGS